MLGSQKMDEDSREYWDAEWSFRTKAGVRMSYGEYVDSGMRELSAFLADRAGPPSA